MCAVLCSGLLQLAGVILCGINVSHGLPVYIHSCPTLPPQNINSISSLYTSRQPLPFHLASSLPPPSSTAVLCYPRTASAYLVAAVGAGLALSAGLVGVAMMGVVGSRDPDDEPLLDGVADFVTSQPTQNHVTE